MATVMDTGALQMGGLPREEILSLLESFKVNDLSSTSGKTFAYTYLPAEQELKELQHDAYLLYLTENGLDPTTFPSMHKVEMEIVTMLRELLRGDENVVGNCTFGGTESVLCAMKTARDWAREHKPHIKEPEMIIPITAHPSFQKAAAYFNIKPVVTGINQETYQADVDAIRQAITPNTIILVGSAPGYAQGVVDPIPEIAAAAQEQDLLCHVDACVGGILLSFQRRMGEVKYPDFDFSVPGVTSISTDMHKYGFAPKNISTVLYRGKELRKHQIFSCRRTTTYALINPTILSSKTGGSMAAAWATLKFLGEDGYREYVADMQKTTRALVDGVNKIPGLRVLGDPDMVMFSFTADDFNIFQLADELRDMGWYVQPQFTTPVSPPNLHLTLTRTSGQHVDAFLADLAKAAEAVRNSPEQIDAQAVREQVQGMLQQIEASGGDPRAAVFAMAGMDGGTLPGKMGLINTVMDALPDDLAEALLTEFINELYS